MLGFLSLELHYADARLVTPPSGYVTGTNSFETASSADTCTFSFKLSGWIFEPAGSDCRSSTVAKSCDTPTVVMILLLHLL